MRITGGTLRGRRLRVPGGGVRPTQDRVREALFSMLGARVAGARFLDLYAGSGSVGLGACSRGAAEVCWVESNRGVLPVLRRNVAELSGESGRVVTAAALDFLRKGLATAPYDIIFADPPYAGSATGKGVREGTGDPRDQLLAAACESGKIAPGGIWVHESRADGAAAECKLPSWRVLDVRTYGQSRLTFLGCGDVPPGDAEEVDDDASGHLRGDV